MEKINEVMVIDDDPTLVFLAKRLVEISKRVETISAFEEGNASYLELISRVQKGIALPDIIFLDLAMPVWDGWSFLEEFQKLNLEKHPVIYILTSSANRDDKNKAALYGLADRYIEKPISLEMLNKVFNEYTQTNS